MNGSHLYVAGSSDETWGSPVNPFTGTYNAFVAEVVWDDEEMVALWNTFVGGPDGSVGWSTSFPAYAVTAIAASGNGQVFVTGKGSGTWGSPIFMGCLVFCHSFVGQLNADGALQWHTHFSYTYMANDRPSEEALAVDGKGGLFVVGSGGVLIGPPPVRSGSGASVYKIALPEAPPPPPPAFPNMIFLGPILG